MIPVLAAFLLLSPATADQNEQPRAHGVIHGIVRAPDGQPAKGVGLTAYPLGVALATMLPQSKTNQAGEYRFENIRWWGPFTVYAEDEEAGYSSFSTGPAGLGNPPEVELSQEQPEAELNLDLPPPAGFLLIHLTNRKTGEELSALEVSLSSAESTPRPLFTESCSSSSSILIPPNRDLLLHVTSFGFREWDQSMGRGKPLRMPSGSHLTLHVQLEPSH